MSTPIKYASTPLNDNYVFTAKKYAISNGRPDFNGFVSYRNHPNGPWYPAYNYDQYHPNGTGYYIISNTRVQGGHATAGNEIPTFQVTGNTDAAILHLINRLQNRTTFYTNIDTAREAIINDPESLQFDAALSKYAYYAPQHLKLNFDFGNLNCDYKSDGGADRIYNFSSNFSGYFAAGLGGGSWVDGNDNSSFYRQVPSFTAVGLTSASGLGTVTGNTNDDFLVAMSVNIPTPPGGPIIIFQTTNIVIRYDGSTNIRIESSGDIAQASFPIGSFNTVMAGRDSTLGKFFIYVYDNTGTSYSDEVTDNSQPALPFTTTRIGDTGNVGEFYIGILQYWKNSVPLLIGLSSNIIESKMKDVSQFEDIFAPQIYNLYSSRWN
jgi:hypothetical protein